MGSNGTTRRRFSGRLLPLLLLSLAAFLPRAGWCNGTIANGRFTLQADSSIVSASSVTDSVPIAVTVTNSGNDPVDADLTAHSEYGYTGHHLYHRSVRIPGGGVPTHVLLYPSTEGYETTFIVELTTRYTSLRTQVALNVSPRTPEYYNTTDNGTSVLCLVGTRLGSLSPMVHATKDGASAATLSYHPAYIKPVNAPTRPVGYRGMNYVLITRDVAAQLSHEQTLAIRRWVTAGGSLVFLGATADSMGATSLAPVSDDFAALLPVRLPNTALAVNEGQVVGTETMPLDSAISSLSDSGYSHYFPGISTPVVSGELTPGATRIASIDSSKGVWTARRYLGAGTVVYCGIDPTSREMRAQGAYLNRFWNEMASVAAPYCTFKQLKAQPNNAPWVADAPAISTDDAPNAVMSSDPFHLALPALREVLYLFLVYFVLAVPVTFVVLKRTRRMNLAWATGPILAVVFAAAFCLFSIRLYSEPLARRTAGVLVASGDDREAQFTGYTEIFFPHSGSYDVSVPQADTTELYSEEYRNASAVNQSGTFETWDDGNAVSAPDLGVANLAFRRVFHTQTASLGGGIHSDLRSSAENPYRLVGTVTNDTGMTIHNVVFKDHRAPEVNGNMPTSKMIDLKPGVNTIDFLGIEGSNEEWHSSDAVMVGYVSGAAFGPQLGNSVGGDTSVKLVVSLPVSGDGKK